MGANEKWSEETVDAFNKVCLFVHVKGKLSFDFRMWTLQPSSFVSHRNESRRRSVTYLFGYYCICKHCRGRVSSPPHSRRASLLGQVAWARSRALRLRAL